MNAIRLSRSAATRAHRGRGLAAAWLAAIVGSLPAAAPAQQSTIYRCHRLDGQLIFQDKPCDQVAGTREARQDRAGDIIPNAPPAPQVEGPSLTERYENYLDRQARRDAQAPPVTPPPVSAVGTTHGADAETPAPDEVEGYPAYGEDGYPYPVYPYPVYPYPVQSHRPDHGHRPVLSTSPAASPYIDGQGQLPLPRMLPAPGLSLSPPHTAPRPVAPGQASGRGDPNR